MPKTCEYEIEIDVDPFPERCGKPATAKATDGATDEVHHVCDEHATVVKGFYEIAHTGDSYSPMAVLDALIGDMACGLAVGGNDDGDLSSYLHRLRAVRSALDAVPAAETRSKTQQVAEHIAWHARMCEESDSR